MGGKVTLVERDALLLADMLQEEWMGLDEPDPAAVRHLVGEAGGFPSPLRRAYDKVYRRWSHGGSPRDRLACLLLSHAHIAAARTIAGGELKPRGTLGMLGLGIPSDRGAEEHPMWEVSLHYRRPEGDDAALPHEAAERVSSELRKTGMAQSVEVTIDDGGGGYGLFFRLRANDHAQAEATAESIAWTCLDRSGIPFSRSISARSAALCEALTTTST